MGYTLHLERYSQCATIKFDDQGSSTFYNEKKINPGLTKQL